MPQSGKLTVQSIDGYLVQVKTCIVKDEDPALPCDEDFIDSGTGEPAIGTDATGKVKFELSAEQLQKLKQKGYVKFKTVAPQGSRDIIFGSVETKTNQAMILVGTKFFDSAKFNEQIALNSTDTFVLTPFTTMTEMLLKNEKQVTEEKYGDTMKKIAESMGVDPNVITTDYNEISDLSDEKSKKALIAGEILAKLNFLPKTDDDLVTVTNMSTERLTDKLEAEAKPLVGNLVEGLSNTESAEELLQQYKTKAERTIVSVSSGIAEDWRCAINKLNEVVCLGNNAWNNLGNQEFTDKNIINGKFELGHNGELLYLKNNYTPIIDDDEDEEDDDTPSVVHVLVKNPYKTSKDDPEYVNLAGVTKVVTGNSHGCAITLYGEVYCWGNNDSGQLGIGSEDYNFDNANLGYARKVVTGAQGAESGHLSNVVDLSLGVDHSCALTEEGDIYCWGDNTAMELGAEFEEQSVSPLFEARDCNGLINDKIKIVADPVKVPAPEGVKFSSISKAGSWAHCALSTKETTDKDGHNLWCWGNDVEGIVTNDNKEYLLELENKSSDWFFDGVSCRSYEYPVIAANSSLWYYTKDGEAVWPMFGKPITNVKSVKSNEEGSGAWQVCDRDSLETENPVCHHVYWCNDASVKETEDTDAGLKSWEKCVNTGIEIKNVAAVDINGKGIIGMGIVPESEKFEPDSQIHFTTSDAGNVLFTAKTNPGIEEDNPKSKINTISLYGENLNLFEEGEKIKEIRASSKYNVFVVSDKNKLYGVGNSPFGRVGAPDDKNRFAINFDDDMVQEVSVNQRSVCALVADEQSAASMLCWGSRTFGQLGIADSQYPVTVDGSKDYSYGYLFNSTNGGNFIYIFNYKKLFEASDNAILSTPQIAVEPEDGDEEQLPD